jgi:hypothetical protein
MRAIRYLWLSALLTATPLAYAQDVHVTATITGEIVPGVYGQVVLGARPPPPLVYAQPMIAVPVPQPVAIEPIYLHVPPGHAKHWRKHCHEYNACNRPVYFVRSAEYEPGYRADHEEHEHGHHGRHGHHDDDRDGDHGHHDD